MFAPVSGWNGDNIQQPSAKLTCLGSKDRSHHKDDDASGTTLLEALDCILPLVSPTNKPLCLALQDLYKISSISTVPVDCMETSNLKPSMVVTFAIDNVLAEVKSVEMYHETLE